MRLTTAILIAALLICGCSASGSPVVPDGQETKIKRALQLPQEDRWLWDLSLYQVSEDHQAIERLPSRLADFHFNMNKSIEPPNCANCLSIGKPQIQPDGTIKVKVTLRHPFTGMPKYTGFDVRGTVIFPATRYWKKNEPTYPAWPDYYFVFQDYIPLNFSRAEDGGGQLLNADGFSFYLWPGLNLGSHFEAPIFNYNRGLYAQGPDPDSTVNGFKLFTNGLERRMFLVGETISRTYHIAIPQGEFTFGYVVDASWAPPTTNPVTDPKNDFPFWANSEDGYVLETEQLAPFKTGTYSPNGPMYPYDVTTVTMLTYKDDSPTYINTWLLCPDIKAGSPSQSDVVAIGTWDYWPNDTGIYTSVLGTCMGTYDAPPGKYIALMVGQIQYYNPAYDDYPVQLIRPLHLAFIDLEVAEGE